MVEFLISNGAKDKEVLSTCILSVNNKLIIGL